MTENRSCDPVEARKKAMDYLARREHGRAELFDKLVTAGFDSDVADATLETLIADNLQSDERFVEAFVSSRINQGKGPARIRAELRERSISGRLVDNALAEAGANWTSLAVDVRLKKFGAEQPRDFLEKARQMRFLQSRGFESEQIQAAVSAEVE